MRSAGISLFSCLAVILVFALVAAGHVAYAEPDVLWLGIQDADGMPKAAAAVLDTALSVAVTEALAKRATVEPATKQTPAARRALQELTFLESAPGDALGDTGARALGLAFGAKATIRAWAEVAGERTRLTTFTAAVHRRQAVIHQQEAALPPDSQRAAADWADEIARRVAAKLALAVADVVRDAPTSPAGYAAAAEAFMSEGAPGIAALEYYRAITAAPGEADYYLGSARAYRAAGDDERARRQLEVALKLRPDMAAARLELGRLRLSAGDAAGAAQELKRAIELGAGNEARMALAAVFTASGDLESAGEQYRLVAESDPANAEAAKRAAEIAVALAPPGGTEELHAAAEAAPDSEVLAKSLLDAYVERGEVGEAIGQLRLLAGREDGRMRVEPRDYVRIARLLDREMEAVLEQARREWDGLARAAVTKEQAGDAVKALHERSDALAQGVEMIAAPAALERGHRHRALAFSLLNQSDFLLLRYLQRGEDAFYDEALIARRAAAAELNRAWDLDAEGGWPTRTAAEN